MTQRMKFLLAMLGHYRYLIVVVVGTLVVGFLDENSVMQRVRQQIEIDDLREEIRQHNAQNESDKRQLRLLRHSRKAIERVARERYFMKCDDEDVYVISDAQPAQNP